MAEVESRSGLDLERPSGQVAPPGRLVDMDKEKSWHLTEGRGNDPRSVTCRLDRWSNPRAGSPATPSRGVYEGPVEHSSSRRTLQPLPAHLREAAHHRRWTALHPPGRRRPLSARGPRRLDRVEPAALHLRQPDLAVWERPPRAPARLPPAAGRRRRAATRRPRPARTLRLAADRP